jgi:hypothetical protein
MAMMPKVAVFVAATLLLAACQQAPVRDETSHRSRVGVGSTFVLHQGLSVPEGHARVFLQGGEVVAKLKLDRYRPHCNFEVRQVSDGTLRIDPDTFLVTDIDEYEDEIVALPQQVRLAALVGGDSFDSISVIARFVRHRFSSERQPGVMRLTCHGGFDLPRDALTPSIAEIRQALGGVVTLNLARE